MGKHIMLFFLLVKIKMSTFNFVLLYIFMFLLLDISERFSMCRSLCILMSFLGHELGSPNNTNNYR